MSKIKFELIIIDKNGNEQILKEPKQYENLTFYAKDTCENSIIRVYEPVKFIKGCVIDLRGGTEVELHSTKYAYNINILTASGAKNQKISIREDCSFWNNVHFNLTEDNAMIEIGRDCMFSKNIEIWASDGHAIYEENEKKVINKCRSKVIIGNHVWVGSNVIFTKSGSIGDNSVVGTGSVVTKNFMEGNIVIAGNPAKVIKKGINWSRKRPAQFEEELKGSGNKERQVSD